MLINNLSVVNKMTQLLKKYSLYLYILSCLTSNISFAFNNTTIELSNISDILKHVNKNTIVLLDIDNTLVTSTQTLGSDQWFDYLVAKNVDEGQTEQNAIDNALAKWHKVQYVTSVRAMEPTTAYTISELQNKAKHVVALTARSTILTDNTYRQLKEVGIDFKTEKQIQDMAIVPDKNSILKNGIITVNLSNKGTAMQNLISRAKIDLSKIDKIIFVDDKQYNIDNVAKAAEQLKVNFLGVRYSQADAQVKKFSAKIAERQFTFYEKCGKIISDKVAKIKKVLKSCNIVA